MRTAFTEETTNRLRDWWYRAMTDPNPVYRAEALDHLRAFANAEGGVARCDEERLELGITEGILAFIEQNFKPAQKESSCSEDTVPPLLY